MSSSQNLGVSIADDLMAQVSKDFFFDGMVLPVDVFLKLRMDQYLVIGKQSEKCAFSNLHSYQNANSLIFVKGQDKGTLIDSITQFTEKVVTQKGIPDTVKTKFLVGLTENALRAFDGKNFTSVAELNRVSQLITGMSKTISNFDEILSILRDLKGEDAKHAMATCMVSVMLAEESGITLKNAIEKLALGALLHDIGLKHIPKEILEKPRHKWTIEENAIYETHPLKGVEMLRDLRDISNDVLLIVAEHHENAIGTGFPKKIRDVKISPLSRFVIVASYFTSLLFSQHGDGRLYDSEQAMVYMNDILGQPFNKQVFSTLKTILAKNELRDKMKGSA